MLNRTQRGMTAAIELLDNADEITVEHIGREFIRLAESMYREALPHSTTNILVGLANAFARVSGSLLLGWSDESNLSRADFERGVMLGCDSVTLMFNMLMNEIMSQVLLHPDKRDALDFVESLLHDRPPPAPPPPTENPS